MRDPLPAVFHQVSVPEVAKSPLLVHLALLWSLHSLFFVSHLFLPLQLSAFISIICEFLKKPAFPLASVVLHFSTVGRSGATDEGEPFVNADRSGSAVLRGNRAANDLVFGVIAVSIIQKNIKTQ